MDLAFYSIVLCSAALFVLALLLIGKARARRRSRMEASMPLPVFFRIDPAEPARGVSSSSGTGASNGRGATATPPRSPIRDAPVTSHPSAPASTPFRYEPTVEPAPPPPPPSRATPIITPHRGIAAAAAMQFAPDRSPERSPSRDQLPDEKTVVFQRHTDGPLELLPGRLEVVEGDGEGRDIRFMRAWGESPEVTFGRTRGPAHRHVQLAAPTVSRNHARMLLEGDRWKIINLSATNPVVINGEELPPENARILSEGDRIEMGEVIFRYRER
jgi:hypothetical protein